MAATPDREPTLSIPRRKRRSGSKTALVSVAAVVLLVCSGCSSGEQVDPGGETTVTLTSAAPTTTSTTSPHYAQPTPITVLGEGIVATFESLVAGDAQPMFDSFNPAFKRELPLDMLEGTWEATVNLSGPYRFTNGMRYEDDGTYRAVILEAVFKVRAVDIRFVFDENDRVSGLFFEEPPQTE